MNDKGIAPPSNELERIAANDHGHQRAVSRMAQSAGSTGTFAAGGERGKIRASDADRDRVVELLNLAYSEGRLSKEEYDARLDSAVSARTFADLDLLVTDLPAAMPSMVPPGTRTTGTAPVARTNALAIASLACGLAQFVFGPMATIPAIILGHVARSQIKRTGEQGAGLALAGLMLGWTVVILAVIVIVVGLAIAAGMHGTISMH